MGMYATVTGPLEPPPPPPTQPAAPTVAAVPVTCKNRRRETPGLLLSNEFVIASTYVLGPYPTFHHGKTTV
jgi:hypothetical protein